MGTGGFSSAFITCNENSAEQSSVSTEVTEKKGFSIILSLNLSLGQETDILYNLFSKKYVILRQWGLIRAIFLQSLKLSLIPNLWKGKRNSYHP